ncbi:hypothetical protein PV328_001066 [Microctonus aethiopoides]|uniref:Uncharacterized protein n=1 Tax=Microctonus aethiopoides TaxID=144406 RepID=A0AA39FWI6_9HYME|nr:hypothetical protein PV328_001066 [Microctonus aethiopoides]
MAPINVDWMMMARAIQFEVNLYFTGLHKNATPRHWRSSKNFFHAHGLKKKILLIMEKRKCSIGIFKNEKCSKGKSIQSNEFSDEDRISLNIKSGTFIRCICGKHDNENRIAYTENQKVSADMMN